MVIVYQFHLIFCRKNKFTLSNYLVRYRTVQVCDTEAAVLWVSSVQILIPDTIMNSHYGYFGVNEIKCCNIFDATKL